MNWDDRLRIRCNYKTFIDSLDLTDVVDDLVAGGILDDEVLLKINNANINPSRHSRIRRLLRELVSRGPEAYSVFYTAMKQVSYYQHIIDGLDNTDLELAYRKYGRSASEQINRSASEQIKRSASEQINRSASEQIKRTASEPGSAAKQSRCADDDVLRIKVNYELLVETVRFDDVCDTLYSDGVINEEQMELMEKISRNGTEKQQTRKLLDLIMKIGSFGYESLLKSLQGRGRIYHHVIHAMQTTDVDKAREKFRSAPIVSATADMKPAFRLLTEDSTCLSGWKQFRALPGIEESDVVCVEFASRWDGPKECLYQLLTCWLRKQGRVATIQVLLDTLETMKFRAAREKIVEAYNCS